MMLVIIGDDYQDVSIKAAHFVAKNLQKKPNLVLGLATGNTPLGLYKELVRLHKEEGLDFWRVTTFNLDEYLGLTGNHQQSFHYYIHKNFLDHVNINPKSIHVPDGGIRSNFEEYCQQYEDAIRNAGGIDLQILGIGKTGHIGFNEPTSSLASRTRIKTLAEPTIQENQKTFGTDAKVPPCAITMGIGTILEAKRILLLASGAHKSDAIAKAIEGPITSTITASALQMHEDVTVVLDQEAATRLAYKDYYTRVLQMTAQLTPEKVE
jgi:glucosamine-6-phosphate deaminase